MKALSLALILLGLATGTARADDISGVTITPMAPGKKLPSIVWVAQNDSEIMRIDDNNHITITPTRRQLESMLQKENERADSAERGIIRAGIVLALEILKMQEKTK